MGLRGPWESLGDGPMGPLGVAPQPFRMDCNGASTELLPLVTCLRINGFARNVISLKRSYYGGTPTRDTS